MASDQIPVRFRGSFRITLTVLWIGLASGFYVQVEPAPYDLILVGLLALLALTGTLRLPEGTAGMLSLLGLFFIAHLISIVPSFDYDRSLFFAAVTVYLVLTGLLIMCLIVEDEDSVLDTVWSAYIFAAAMASIFAIIGYFRLIPDPEFLLEGGRAQSLFKDPNVLGPFLVPAALLLFSRFETRRGAAATWALVLLPLILVGILLSFSRGAWGNLVLSFLTYLGLRIITNRQGTGAGLMKLTGAAIAMVGIGTLVVSYLVLFTDVGEMFAAKTTVFRYYDTHRFAAQQHGLETAFTTPIGIGPGLSEDYLGIAAHSLYVRVFLENGWLGGLSFLAFIIYTIARGLAVVLRGHADPRVIVAAACIVGICLNSIVIDSVHWRHFFLLIGLVWGSVLAFELRERARGLERAMPWRYAPGE